MSRVPMWSNVPDGQDPFGPTVAARYPAGLVPQGISAELIAAKWAIGRRGMDEFATASHRRAAAATEAGLFRPEVAPVTVTRDDGTTVVSNATRASARRRRPTSSPASAPPTTTRATPPGSPRSPGT